MYERIQLHDNSHHAMLYSVHTFLPSIYKSLLYTQRLVLTSLKTHTKLMKMMVLLKFVLNLKAILMSMNPWLCIYLLFQALQLVSYMPVRLSCTCFTNLPLFLAGVDFEPLRAIVEFTERGVKCVDISLVTGDAIEHLEKFSVALTTQEDCLEVKKYFVPVYIVDDDCESMSEYYS